MCLRYSGLLRIFWWRTYMIRTRSVQKNSQFQSNLHVHGVISGLNQEKELLQSSQQGRELPWDPQQQPVPRLHQVGLLHATLPPNCNIFIFPRPHLQLSVPLSVLRTDTSVCKTLCSQLDRHLEDQPDRSWWVPFAPITNFPCFHTVPYFLWQAQSKCIVI